MILNKIILGILATIIASITGFTVGAFRSDTYQCGTLATFNAATEMYNCVPCVRSGGLPSRCPNVTYYTCINHTKVGKIAPQVCSE